MADQTAKRGAGARIANILSTGLLAAALAVAGVVVAQRMGWIGTVIPVIQEKAGGSSSVPTSKPGAKNAKAYLAKDDPSIASDRLSPRRFQVIDLHEHAQNEEEAKRLIEVMDELGVKRTCLMASSIYTFTLNNMYGFEQFKDNNEVLIDLKKKWPDRLCAFMTIHPPDDGNLELLKDYAARGADGVKLYLGHGAATGKGPFHMMPLDDPRMLPIYAWAQEVQFPIVMHVNLNKYWDEFLSVMEKFPHLRISVPHIGLHKNTEQRLKRFGWLLDRYPNLYTDLSYGYYTFHIEGFEALSKWRTRSREFLTRYADRILYGSDMVLEKTKDRPYILNTMRSYMQHLEEEMFRFFLVPDRLMHGMKLDDAALKKIYEDAPKQFLLLDKDGNLPDRSQGWPAPGVVEPPRNPLRPLDRSTIPPLTVNGSANPSAKGKGGDEGGDDGPGASGANGENEAHAHFECEGERD